jgi:16S rRNA processing protein RimM
VTRGDEAARRLVVARVRGFQGLRGVVRLEPLSDRAQERFAPGAVLFVEGSDDPLTVAESGPGVLGWRVRFVEIADRTAAERLRDVYLEAIVEPDRDLAEGEYYWYEVVGASVVEMDGTVLGQVTDVYRAGGAEVLVVTGPSGEFDVPVVRSVVRVFEPDRGEIVVDGDALGLADAEAPEGEAHE